MIVCLIYLILGLTVGAVLQQDDYTQNRMRPFTSACAIKDSTSMNVKPKCTMSDQSFTGKLKVSAA